MSIKYSVIVILLMGIFCSILPAPVSQESRYQKKYEQLKQKVKETAKKLKKYMPGQDGCIALGIIAVVLGGSYGWRWYHWRSEQLEYTDGLKAENINVIVNPDSKKPEKSILKQTDKNNKDSKKLTWFDGKSE